MPIQHQVSSRPYSNQHEKCHEQKLADQMIWNTFSPQFVTLSFWDCFNLQSSPTDVKENIAKAGYTLPIHVHLFANQSIGSFLWSYIDDKTINMILVSILFNTPRLFRLQGLAIVWLSARRCRKTNLRKGRYLWMRPNNRYIDSPDHIGGFSHLCRGPLGVMLSGIWSTSGNQQPPFTGIGRGRGWLVSRTQWSQ